VDEDFGLRPQNDRVTCSDEEDEEDGFFLLIFFYWKSNREQFVSATKSP